MTLSAHLRGFEAESTRIIREVPAAFRKPVILYSVGKNSSVVLHLARKASIPAACPFLWLHVDTTWKFREMIAFGDETAAVDIRLTELYVQPHTYRPGKRRSFP
jgi:sulfate adenylyltransferase subunit 2